MHFINSVGAMASCPPVPMPMHIQGYRNLRQLLSKHLNKLYLIPIFDSVKMEIEDH